MSGADQKMSPNCPQNRDKFLIAKNAQLPNREKISKHERLVMIFDKGTFLRIFPGVDFFSGRKFCQFTHH